MKKKIKEIGTADIGIGGTAGIGKKIDAVPLGPEDIPKVTGKDSHRILQTLAPGKKAIFQTLKGVKFVVQMNPDRKTFNIFHLGIKIEPRPVNPRPMSTEEVLAALENMGAGLITQEGKNMRTSDNIIKKDLLRRKVQEHFSKHPKSRSVIVKADIGECKTVWKVNRIKKGFRIIEVNTKREEFLVEAPITRPGMKALGGRMGKAEAPPGYKASPAFLKMQKDFQVAIMQPDHTKLSQFQKQLQDQISAHNFELETLGAFSGQITGMIDVSTRQVPGGLTANKKNKGKKLGEAEEEPNKDSEEDPKKDSEKKPKEKELAKKPEPPQMSDIKPDDTGLETGADITPPTVTGEEPKTGEQVALQQIFQRAGPVKDMFFDTDDSGIDHVIIKFTGMENDLSFIILPSGKTSYKFGDQSPRIVKTGRGG